MENVVLTNVYINGEADGIINSFLKLSPIEAFIVPRNLLNKAKLVEGIKNPGVYFLIGEESENSVPKMYIGETGRGINRIIDHDRKKDFWGKVILFLADEKHFDQTFIDQLEEYLIVNAKNSNRYIIENNNVPKTNKRPHDAGYIKKAYEEISFLMASFGYPLDNLSAIKKHNKILQTSRRGIIAIGTYLGDKFELLEGSQIDMSKKCHLEKYNQMRDAFIEDDSLVKSSSNKDIYILNKTLSFKSPSGAAEFALGGSINGWDEWKDKNGKTLADLYRK